MDIIIGGTLIIIIMLCLGFGWGDIAVLGLGAVGVIVVLIGSFFAVCLLMLALSKRKTAVFTEFSEEGRFPCAVYRIDGADVPNMFPCEMIMRGKLYVPGKKIKVLYCRVNKHAIDGNALITMIFGSMIFIPSAVFAAVTIVKVIGMMMKG